MRIRKLALLTVIGLGVALVPFNVEAKPTDKAPLQNFSDASLVGKGAHTTLQRDGVSVSDKVQSRNLVPGHAYTVWLAIFNDPANCVDGCGEDDIENGTGDPAVIWSGVGGIANGGGNLNGNGYVSEGNPQGYQMLFGAFSNAQGAEIHNVVRDHGPDTGNPLQTSTFEGECTAGSSFELGIGSYECEDVQFSIHMA
jgi:hypothetical protein